MNYHNSCRTGRDGSGMRVALYVAGCSHHCEGCHNPETWDVNGGILFDEVAKKELFEMINDKWISGLTLTGGDPWHPANRKVVGEIVKEFKEKFPDKTIWMYTGSTWEELLATGEDWLSLIDVVCDGEFILSLRSVDKHYVGSKNQNVIDVQKSLATNSVVLYEGGVDDDAITSIKPTVIKCSCGA